MKLSASEWASWWYEFSEIEKMVVVGSVGLKMTNTRAEKRERERNMTSKQANKQAKKKAIDAHVISESNVSARPKWRKKADCNLSRHYIYYSCVYTYVYTITKTTKKHTQTNWTDNNKNKKHAFTRVHYK